MFIKVFVDGKFMMAWLYINKCETFGTMLSRIIYMGMSPVKCALRKHKYTTTQQSNGIIDSLRQLFFNEHFIKPYSCEHFMVSLLIKAFLC